jgi:hypothetical protein
MAWKNGELLSPDAIAARVFVWDTCQGLMLPASVVDPRWGLAPRLFASPAIGAVILTWEPVVSEPSLDPLARDLARGLSVGRALARLLAGRESRRMGHRMCLFGDPRLRLPRPQAGVRSGG